jgi:hypothetical protein
MRYSRFLVANAAGGIIWAGGTAFVIFYVGQVAEKYLQKFSWAALVVAVLAGLFSTWFFKHRAQARASQTEAELAAAEEDIDTGPEGVIEAGTVAATVANTATDAIVHHHEDEHSDSR